MESGVEVSIGFRVAEAERVEPDEDVVVAGVPDLPPNGVRRADGRAVRAGSVKATRPLGL